MDLELGHERAAIRIGTSNPLHQRPDHSSPLMGPSAYEGDMSIFMILVCEFLGLEFWNSACGHGR